MMKYNLYVLVILLFFSSPLEAQNASWCGTEISQEWMEAFYQRDKAHLTHKAGNYPEVFIPIVYHIVGDNNGNGYYGLEEVFRSHCELQSLFDDADVNFYIKDVVYINNTNYYNGNNTYGLFQLYNDRDACNVFIVNQMSGVCGYSFVPQAWNDNSIGGGPNRGGIMLAVNCMEPGNTTYRHEMGHYLNLPHTFYGWEGENPPGIGANAPSTINGSPVERADQSNCYVSGDGFCDTPPDYLSDRWTCNFARNYRDPLGNIFTVDEKNFMSYSNDGCSTYLKDEQLAEVNAAAANYRPYLLNDPVPTIVSLGNMSGFSPMNNTNNLNPSSVVISWNAVPNATYYHMQATLFNFNNPTIDIVTQDTFYVVTNPSSNSEYQWRVKPVHFTNVCTDFTPIMKFSTSVLSASIDVTNSTCSENADGRITVNLNQTGPFNYYWSCDDLFINSTIQNINANTISNLAPERYTVIVVKANTGDTLLAQIQVVSPNEMQVAINQVGGDLVASITGGTPPYSFVWNTGSESLSLSNLASGDYNIIVVDQNGCQKSAIGTFDSAATPIRAVNEVFTSLVVAPNPANSDFAKLLVSMEQAGEVQLTMSDISGKMIYASNFEGELGANMFPLDLTGLSNGIYFVNVSANGLRKSTKLVVNH